MLSKSYVCVYSKCVQSVYVSICCECLCIIIVSLHTVCMKKAVVEKSVQSLTVIFATSHPLGAHCPLAVVTTVRTTLRTLAVLKVGVLV